MGMFFGAIQYLNDLNNSCILQKKAYLIYCRQLITHIIAQLILSIIQKEEESEFSFII
jgi:hypothetical protein